MVYTDLIFLLCILPVSVILSLLDSSAEYKNLILVITSLVFFSWGKPLAVCLIFLTVIVDWAIGLLMKKYDKNKVAKDILLTADLIVNVGIFIVFAHNNIFSKTSALSISEAVIPLGIAFYAVRGFSYAYDVYKGNCSAEKNVFCLITYMTSFHLMLAGPIVRYNEIEPAIRNRTVTGADINKGLTRLVIGLGKAVLIAPAFERIKLAGLNGSEITLLGCYLGMLAFFAQYYFLFTGFCDMGKGLGFLNGFDYPENYKDIEADGLFGKMAQGFNCTLVKFFSDIAGVNRDRKNIAALVICGLTGGMLGLWYEAKLNFFIVGVVVGLICVVEKLWLSKFFAKLPENFLGKAVKYIYMAVLAMLVFGGLYFDSFYGYQKWLFGLIGVGTKYTLSVAVKYAVLNNITLIIIAAFIVLPALKKTVLKGCEALADKSTRLYGIVRISQTVLCAAVFLVCICTLTVQNGI